MMNRIPQICDKNTGKLCRIRPEFFEITRTKKEIESGSLNLSSEEIGTIYTLTKDRNSYGIKFGRKIWKDCDRDRKKYTSLHGRGTPLKCIYVPKQFLVIGDPQDIMFLKGYLATTTILFNKNGKNGKIIELPKIAGAITRGERPRGEEVGIGRCSGAIKSGFKGNKTSINY